MKTYTDIEVKKLFQEFVDVLSKHPVVTHADGKVWFVGAVKEALKGFLKGKGLS